MLPRTQSSIVAGLALVVLTLGLLASTMSPVLAQGNATTAKTKPATSATSVYKEKNLDNPLGSRNMTIPEVIGRVIQIFTGIVGSLALLMFVYGGIVMMLSRGDASQVQKGKTIMVQATIGLVVIFTAYGLVTLIFNALGVRSI
jgi:hypothetical protein